MKAHSRRSCPRGPVQYDSTGWECFQQTAASSQTCPNPLQDAPGASTSDLTHSWDGLPGPEGLNQYDLVSPRPRYTPLGPPQSGRARNLCRKPRLWNRCAFLDALVVSSMQRGIRCPKAYSPGTRVLELSSEKVLSAPTQAQEVSLSAAYI